MFAIITSSYPHFFCTPTWINSETTAEHDNIVLSTISDIYYYYHITYFFTEGVKTTVWNLSIEI